MTLVQRLVPDRLLGRVFSLDWMISTLGVPLSFAITGPTAEEIGHDATLIWAGALGGTITLAFMFVQGARGPERDGSLATQEPSAKAALGYRSGSGPHRGPEGRLNLRAGERLEHQQRLAPAKGASPQKRAADRHPLGESSKNAPGRKPGTRPLP